MVPPRYNAPHYPTAHAMRFLATLLLPLALAGCGSIIHRIDIQQGNLVAPETFAKLKPGMIAHGGAHARSARRCSPTSSTPTAGTTTSATSSAAKLVEQNRFTVFFENEKVVRIEGGPTLSAAGTAPKK